MRSGVNNTMSTGTGSQGGYVVQTEVVPMIMDALKQYGGVRQVATVIQTEQGNPLNWPNSDGTSEVGELVAENAAVASADTSFGSSSLATYKFSSRCWRSRWNCCWIPPWIWWRSSISVWRPAWPRHQHLLHYRHRLQPAEGRYYRRWRRQGRCVRSDRHRDL